MSSVVAGTSEPPVSTEPMAIGPADNSCIDVCINHTLFCHSLVLCELYFLLYPSILIEPEVSALQMLLSQQVSHQLNISSTHTVYVFLFFHCSCDLYFCVFISVLFSLIGYYSTNTCCCCARSRSLVEVLVNFKEECHYRLPVCHGVHVVTMRVRL